MTQPTELSIKAEQLRLREIALRNEQSKLFIEFAKFGFGGTLSGGLFGMLLLFALAVLQAFTTFKLEAWGYVTIAAIIVLAVIAYGYFSLWSLPKIAAKFKDIQMDFAGPGAMKQCPHCNKDLQ